MAVRFAAKEATYKCLIPSQQTGVSWQDIEVFIDGTGQPHIRYSGSLANALNDYHTHVSLSHTGNTAIAMVVIEKLISSN